MLDISKLEPQKIMELKKKIQEAATTWLLGLNKPAGLLAECFFMQIPYTDKITVSKPTNQEINTDPSLGRKVFGNNSKLTKPYGQPHIMFKGGTGIGKTDMVQSGASTLRAKFSRISCTPDMMPYDILGGQVLVENTLGERRVQFKPGPIFAHLVLLDEANRCQPKTKSAILEAMEERSITPKTEYIADEDRVVGTLPLFPLSGDYRDIDSPRFFMVFLTENIFGEEEGVYPSPMAELDRITLTIAIKRPTLAEEKKIRAIQVVGKSIGEVSDLTEVLACASWINQNVKNSAPADDYLTRLLRNTDPDPEVTDPYSELGRYLAEYLQVGASPRVNFHLEAVARVRAFFDGSPTIRPDHVKAVAKSVIVHRLVLKRGKEFQTTREKVFEQILNMTEMPKWP